MVINSKFKSFVGAALVATAIAGCGGSSSSSTPGTQVNVSGGVATGSTTSNTGANATTAPVQITLADGTVGTLTTGIIPAGGTGFIIPKGAFLFTNLGFPGGLSATRGTHNVYLTAVDDQQQFTNIGTISSNQTTGVQLDSTIVFPTVAHSYDVQLTGPFVVTSGNTTLNVKGNLYLHFEVSSAGISLPATVTGQLPANGGTAFDNNQALNCTIPGYADRSFRLVIDKSTGQLDQTRQASGTSVTFNKNTATNGAIPADGVDSISFGIVNNFPF